MESTTGNALLLNFEITDEESFVNRTDQPWAFHPPALPPGWTYEKFLYIRSLLDVRMILCGIGLLANSLVLLLQLKLKTYKKTQLIFAFALTATDGVVCPAIFMQTYHYRNLIEPVPLVYHAINFATTVMSSFVIIAVAFDRYLALCAFPLKYKLVVNLRRYTLVIIVLCILSAGYGCLFSWYFTFEESSSTGLRTFILSTFLVFITILIYVFVFLSLSRSNDNLSLPKALKNSRIRQTRRVMFAFSLILSTNVICNLPQSFFGLYIFFQPIGEGYEVYEHNVISNWLYNLQCLNYTLNPVIYWWQVLLREFSLPLRKNDTKLKTNTSSTIAEVSTVTSKKNEANFT